VVPRLLVGKNSASARKLRIPRAGRAKRDAYGPESRNPRPESEARGAELLGSGRTHVFAGITRAARINSVRPKASENVPKFLDITYFIEYFDRPPKSADSGFFTSDVPVRRWKNHTAAASATD